MVAYHSCAQVEAEIRGLGAELASEFSLGDPLLADVLLYCDMTTGPDGDYVWPADRLAEIRERYGSDHEVTRFVERAASEILAIAQRVDRHSLAGHRLQALLKTIDEAGNDSFSFRGGRE